MNGSDPHDQLLLTQRPTTIVTQHTTMLDNMPTPYGDQDDEEALFAQVGDDNGFARNALASDLAADGVASRLPGTAPEGSPSAQLAVSGAREGITQMGWILAIGLGVGWLLTRK